MTNTNYDPEEVAKFDALGSQWWDKQGPLKTLHDINPARLKYIEEAVSLNDSVVADIGCGGGILSEAMARRGATVTAIDLAPDAIEAGKAHAKIHDLTIDYRVQSLEMLADMSAGQFDVVTCMEMLEHVPEPADIIKCCAKLLKPGGVLFASTINRTPKAFLSAIVGAEYILNILPRGTHHYAKLIQPAELTRLCRDVGLTVGGFRGINYNPWSRQTQLSNNVSVNYLLHALA